MNTINLNVLSFLFLNLLSFLLDYVEIDKYYSILFNLLNKNKTKYLPTFTLYQ